MAGQAKGERSRPSNWVEWNKYESIAYWREYQREQELAGNKWRANLGLSMEFFAKGASESWGGLSLDVASLAAGMIRLPAKAAKYIRGTRVVSRGVRAIRSRLLSEVFIRQAVRAGEIMVRNEGKVRVIIKGGSAILYPSRSQLFRGTFYWLSKHHERIEKTVEGVWHAIELAHLAERYFATNAKLGAPEVGQSHLSNHDIEPLPVSRLEGVPPMFPRPRTPLHVYIPGPTAQRYGALARQERDNVDKEVDRRFRQETGVTRLLDNSLADRPLVRTWLTIRDEVMREFAPPTRSRPLTRQQSSSRPTLTGFGRRLSFDVHLRPLDIGPAHALLVDSLFSRSRPLTASVLNQRMRLRSSADLSPLFPKPSFDLDIRLRPLNIGPAHPLFP